MDCVDCMHNRVNHNVTKSGDWLKLFAGLFVFATSSTCVYGEFLKNRKGNRFDLVQGDEIWESFKVIFLGFDSIYGMQEWW
jgi:hypothetical protein